MLPWPQGMPNAVGIITFSQSTQNSKLKIPNFQFSTLHPLPFILLTPIKISVYVRTLLRLLDRHVA